VLLSKYYSGDRIKNEIGGYAAHIGERRSAHMVMVWKPEGKRPHGRSRPRWEDKIKMYLRKKNRDMTGMNWLRIGTGGGIL
jgi:hypothetical protein